nr:MAG TPA: hypothetical protein [Caudoviricetes sp.]
MIILFQMVLTQNLEIILFLLILFVTMISGNYRIFS